jgi:hypothetical protein
MLRTPEFRWHCTCGDVIVGAASRADEVGEAVGMHLVIHVEESGEVMTVEQAEKRYEVKLEWLCPCGYVAWDQPGGKMVGSHLEKMVLDHGAKHRARLFCTCGRQLQIPTTGAAGTLARLFGHRCDCGKVNRP